MQSLLVCSDIGPKYKNCRKSVSNRIVSQRTMIDVNICRQRSTYIYQSLCIDLQLCWKSIVKVTLNFSNETLYFLFHILIVDVETYPKYWILQVFFS